MTSLFCLAGALLAERNAPFLKCTAEFEACAEDLLRSQSLVWTGPDSTTLDEWRPRRDKLLAEWFTS
jgi:hypothetical protein